MHIKTVFRALRHKNYRLFFAGQSISLVGTWMQQISLGWLVARRSGWLSFLLVTIGFATTIQITASARNCGDG